MTAARCAARIVSLVPSATEIVCRLGLGDRLVGVSCDCVVPRRRRGVAVLSRPTVEQTAASSAIDRRVRRGAHTGTSVYHLDEAALARLRPDLILTQELCTVCAPSFTSVTRAARLLEGAVRVVSLEPRTIGDMLDNVRLVAALAGVPARGRAAVAELRDRLAAVAAGRPRARPRVAVIEWLDPIYVGGHWVPEMVALAGGRDVLGAAGGPSRRIAWRAVRAARPEVLVVAPCGFDVARARAEMRLLTDRPGWRDLPAVRDARVHLVDASSYVSRPGPGLVVGVEILAGVLRPGGRAPAWPRGAVRQFVG